MPSFTTIILLTTLVLYWNTRNVRLCALVFGASRVVLACLVALFAAELVSIEELAIGVTVFGVVATVYGYAYFGILHWLLSVSEPTIAHELSARIPIGPILFAVGGALLPSLI